MKVLHIALNYEPDFHMGGVVRSTSQLCRGLAKLGHEVTVFTTAHPKGDAATRATVNKPVEVGGVRVLRFRDYYKSYFPTIQMLISMKEVLQYDLIHIAEVYSLFAGPIQFLAKRMKLPYIVSPRGGMAKLFDPHLSATKHRLYYWGLYRKHLQGASAIHYTAKLERNESLRLKHKSPSFIVPNPINWREFEHLPSKEEALASLDLPQHDKMILFLGRLDSRKALDVLIDSFHTARQKVEKTILVLAGPDFGEELRLRRMVSELGLEREIIFTGFVNAEKRAQLFSVADLCTLVTYRGENFGISAAEAMAAGVPVLVSDETGIADDVEQYRCGAVTPVDTQQVGDTLVDLLQDDDALKQMGENGRKLVRTKYDKMTVTRLMVQAYEDLLAGQTSPQCAWRREVSH